MLVQGLLFLLAGCVTGRSSFDLKAEVECRKSTDDFPVFIPNPTDCNKYYVCDGMTPISMDCPAELYFDPELNVCNWPENVDCQASGEEASLEESSEEESSEEEPSEEELSS